MLATIRTASTIALVLLAAAAQAGEDELWFRKGERKTLAREIRERGLACAEVKAVYFVGAKPDGHHMRAVCGSKGEAEASVVRMIVRASGGFRAEPWTETDRPPAAIAPFADAFVLRASLD